MPALNFKGVASCNVKLETRAVETRVGLGRVHHDTILVVGPLKAFADSTLVSPGVA